MTNATNFGAVHECPSVAMDAKCYLEIAQHQEMAFWDYKRALRGECVGAETAMESCNTI